MRVFRGCWMTLAAAFANALLMPQVLCAQSVSKLNLYSPYSVIATVKRVERLRYPDVRVELTGISWHQKVAMGLPRTVVCRVYFGSNASDPLQPKAAGSARPWDLKAGDRVLATLWKSQGSRDWYLGRVIRSSWFDPAYFKPGAGDSDNASVPLDVKLQAEPNPALNGQVVRMTVTVRNRSGGRLTFQTASGQIFEIAASLEGRVVWKWSDGKFFTMAIQPVTMKPGETRTYKADWNLKDVNGNKVTPGRYRLSAWITIMGQNKPAAQPVTLVIK